MANQPSRKPNRSSAAAPPRKKTPILSQNTDLSQSGCLSGFLYFLFVVGLSTLMAVGIWAAANDVLGLIKDDHEGMVVITEQDSIADVSEKLHKAGIIQYPSLFKLYASFSDADEKIEPGQYTLNAKLDYRAIVNYLRQTSPYRDTARVSIPEGLSVNEIITLLADKKVNTAQDLLATSRTHAYSYDFLSGLPEADNRLEGFLFPDTYDFYIGENPITVFDKMLANFNKRMNTEYRSRMEELEISLYEMITIASMIEEEAADADDAALISSVIYNRLQSDKFPFLQIDATIQYVLPAHKEKLTAVDLELDNPYNTYRYEGLPPGPITNPGMSSIRAALYPEQTDYYYYAVNKDGVHQFSKTKAEHEKVVEAARAAGLY